MTKVFNRLKRVLLFESGAALSFGGTGRHCDRFNRVAAAPRGALVCDIAGRYVFRALFLPALGGISCHRDQVVISVAKILHD